MTTVIGVRFKKVGKVYYFDPNGLTVKAGQSVIVETARGIECGTCTMGNAEVPDSKIVPPLKKLVRIATQTDLEVAAANERQAREAYQIARRKIEEHKLDMHLVAVECTFDLNKILFYFTADGRVDFRNLVKDLASIFRTRIELRQIGVRDEAKMVGGLGVCGRELCCSSYLDEFQPVSINMAKEQNLSLNPAKISGSCGRLMCCLKYEHEVYVDLQKTTPKTESLVETPEGVGTVISTQMLRGLCKVLLEGEEEPRTFACTDCKVLRSGRARKCAGGCAAKQQPQIDPMEATAPVAEADPPVESRRKRRERSERPAPARPTTGVDSKTESNPESKPERPAREKNGQPRLVKAAPKAEGTASKPTARQPVQRAILVKAAPLKPEPDGADEAEQTPAPSMDGMMPNKKRRRRRGGVRRRRSPAEDANHTDE